MALPERHRLRSASDISLVIRSGRRLRAGSFVVHCRLGSRVAASAEARFAFALPRSVGGAVARNQVRRRVQGVIHRWEWDGLLGTDADVVVRVLPGAAGLGSRAIEEQLTPALRRVGVLLDRTGVGP